MKSLNRLMRWMAYILPAVLFFSYYPVIPLGGNESMNFEFSLPLIWLVIFDVMGLVALVWRRELFTWLKGWRWVWMLFPVWATLSLIWSVNPVRGVLTVGILWLIYLAGYVMWALRDLWDERFRAVWLRWLLGATMVVCVCGVVQCVLDLAGVSQSVSLMCDGCTYHMFGFPHPNGFAVEPQFMGNLLLAPVMVAAWLWVKKPGKKKLELERSRDSHFYNGSGGLAPVFQYRLLARDRCKNDNGSRSLCSSFFLPGFFVIVATLFLTFSRGAIYSSIVGLLFMSGFLVFSVRRKNRFGVLKRVGVVWGVVILSFVVVLNVQGLMAEVGPTNDTYYDGVAKVLNHLSLGVIDIRGEKNTADTSSGSGNTEGELVDDEFVLVENSVENSEGEEAIFDGYVSESTDVRVKLTGVALKTWSQNPSSMLLGVGIGGAGVALYNNGLSSSPKEIVQNEYASLLLETGLIGISLFVLTLVLVFRVVWKRPMRAMVLGLMVAYGVSLIFFSGLPNALQIYLLPMMMVML